MKRLWLIGLFILLSACASENVTPDVINTDFCGSSTLSECGSDSECVSDGCSGQICKSVNDEAYFTTCEWLDCYEKNGLECKCVDNKCSWD